MKQLALALLTLLSLPGVPYVDAGAPSIVKDGNYLGMEPMGEIDPDQPHDKWFHECTMIVRDDNAVIDMLPVVIHKGKKEYSPSDGGFMTYRARFSAQGAGAVAQIRMTTSEYLIFPVGTHDQYTKIETVPVRVHGDQITIRDVVYKPAVIKQDRLDALLQILSTDLLEKHTP